MDVRAGYKQTECGVLPSDWEICQVREKGEVITGKALAATAPGAHRPYLRTKNVFDGRIDIEDVLTMPMTDAQFEQFRIRCGDVLLNEGQSLELVGRCAIYQEEYPQPCAIQNALLRFRAREGTSAKFASYLFRHCQHTGVFARIALQTTSVAHLGGSRFERLVLPWPTEVEQHEIAEVLTGVDSLLAGLDRLIAKKRDLKQAAMQQLLTGESRLRGFSSDWRKACFDDVLVRVNAKTHQLPAQRYQLVGACPVVDQGALTVSAFSDQVENRFRCPNGGVIVFGDHTCVVKFIDFDFLVGADGTQILRGKGGQVTRFHAYQLQHQRVESTGYNRHFKFLKQLTFVAPDAEEQAAIAAVLADMDTELAALEARRAKTQALKQGMMQALLTGQIRLQPSSDPAAGESAA